MCGWEPPGPELLPVPILSPGTSQGPRGQAGLRGASAGGCVCVIIRKILIIIAFCFIERQRAPSRVGNDRVARGKDLRTDRRTLHTLLRKGRGNAGEGQPGARPRAGAQYLHAILPC